LKGCDNIVKTKTEDIEKIGKSKEEHLHTTEETRGNKFTNSDADSNKSPQKSFPIVGSGASAGGLSAFEAFLSVLPANTV